MRPFPFSFALQAKKEAAPATDAAPIAAIEKSGGTVRSLAQNDDRREVSFHLQGAAVKDADIAPVANLSKVVHLHLGKTSVTDAGLAHLKGLSDLEELHLEGTAITDKGLVHLKDLKKLTYLNLYNTAVTDAGLAHLTGLANLKHLYLWQTKVTAEGANKLKQALPALDINRGPESEAKAAPSPEKKEKPN